MGELFSRKSLQSVWPCHGAVKVSCSSEAGEIAAKGDSVAGKDRTLQPAGSDPQHLNKRTRADLLKVPVIIMEASSHEACPRSGLQGQVCAEA